MSSIDAVADMPMNENVTAAPPIAAPQAPSVGRTGRRLLGAIVALGCAAVLLLAAWMTPSESGLGTHQQLNMPPCGWVAVMGMPCPTCGMTTSFAHAADGNLLKSLLTQPLGFILALSTAMALFLGGYTAATGSRVAIVLAGFWTRRTTWWVIGIALAAWVYKIFSYRGLV